MKQIEIDLHKTRNRKLENKDDVFNHNSWDDIDWSEEMLQEAKDRLIQQDQESIASINLGQKVYSSNGKDWDNFYRKHKDNFFKDRKWIFSEFSEIMPHLSRKESKSCMLEVGCGVGNAIGYFSEVNSNPNLVIYCCDISKNAVNILTKRFQDDLESNSDNRIKPSIVPIVADISSSSDFETKINPIIGEETIDIITLIFSLSALNPSLMETTIINLSKLLKKGGIILLRDYAKYDLTQLRFKGTSKISENYYHRSDGTTSYFFDLDTLERLFDKANLVKLELKNDNRILVNRAKSLKMCRCWLQAKYMKPL